MTVIGSAVNSRDDNPNLNELMLVRDIYSPGSILDAVDRLDTVIGRLSELQPDLVPEHFYLCAGIAAQAVDVAILAGQAIAFTRPAPSSKEVAEVEKKILKTATIIESWPLESADPVLLTLLKESATDIRMRAGALRRD